VDSLSQMVLGGAVAGAIAPPRHRRAALVAGAALGTLPDLDSLPILLVTDNPVVLMTMHRGLSHSLLVLPWVGWGLWWWFRRRGGRVADSPVRWFWAIQLALFTHPLLDAFTVYGTQLLWPLRPPPVMWSSVFIIDPLYTLWLLMACLVAWFAQARRLAQRALIVGLMLSTAYLGWSLIAKHLVDKQATRDLTTIGLGEAPRFSVAMPLNTLLWRVVAMTPDGYVIGDRSLMADSGPMRFVAHRSDTQALAQARGIEAVETLMWFNRGFMRAEVVNDTLVLSDLRMGAEPDYVFNFVVAKRDGDTWRAVPPTRMPSAVFTASAGGGLRQALAGVWTRIWRSPPSGSG